MKTLHQKTSELLAALNASPSEWPAYMVLRETVPPNIRVVVAAKIAEEMGDRAEFVDALLDIYESGKSRQLDDLYELPPQADQEHFRRLLRHWLLEGAEERLHFRMLESDTRRDSTERRSNIDILLQVGWLRIASYQQICAWHTREKRFKNLTLAALAENIIKLEKVLSGELKGDLSELCDKAWSPFLLILWFKHCGEQALLHESPGLAREFFGLAQVYLKDISAKDNSHLLLLILQIELSNISAKSLLEGSAVTLDDLSSLRDTYKGSQYADIVEYVRFHLGWESDLESERSKYFSSSYPIEVKVNDTAADLFALPDQLIASSVNDQAGNSGANYWLAAQRSVAAGGYPLLYSLREAWAWALLTDKNPDIKEAMRQVVCSARSTAIQKFERWIERNGDAPLKGLEQSFFDELASLKDLLPSQAKQRESAYVRLLGVVASSANIPDSLAVFLFDRLSYYALNGYVGRWSNVSTKKAGIDGVVALIENHVRPLLELREDSIVGVVNETLLSEYDWPMYEKALRIALECASLINERALLTLINSILNCLEVRMNPSYGDWMLLRPAFAFLGHDKVAAILLASQPEMLDRARTQAHRYCFSESVTDNMRGWEQAFLMIKKLDMGTSNEAKRAIEMHIMHASQSNSSDAAANINRLLFYPDLLSGPQLIRTIDALINIVRWRGDGAGRMAPAIGSAALSVFNLAYQWDSVQASCAANIEQLSGKVTQLFGDCITLLQYAKKWPSVFAQLSFPRGTIPDPAIVYNWAYALLSLATVLGRTGEAREVLSDVSSNSELQSAINQSVGDFENFGLKNRGAASSITLAEIEQSGQNGFYSKLGSILVRIARQPDIAALLRGTLMRCLKEGPRIEDLGVLSMALSVPDLRNTVARDSVIEIYRGKLLRADKSISRNSALVMNNILEALLVPMS